MDSRRLAYLKALEIDVWERRDGAARVSVPQADAVAAPSVQPIQARTVQMPAAVEPKVDLADGADVSKLGWEELATAVRSCTKCP